MSTSSLGTAVVTGASSGIGKVYADRLARRGYDLLLVARNKERLDALATDLTAATGRHVEVLAADLEKPADVARIVERLASDPGITLLVNNAGAGTEGPVLNASAAKTDGMVQLNVVALTQLSLAAVNAFARNGRGTLINIASVVALMPERLLGAYSATKAYVLNFTQSLQNEFKNSPLRIQAVLPGLTRTEFFDRAGMDVSGYPPEMLMAVDELVDGALAGLDLDELITIPSLPEATDWDNLSAARMSLWPNLSLNHPAARYGL